MRSRARALTVAPLLALAVTLGLTTPAASAPADTAQHRSSRMAEVIPAPVSAHPNPRADYRLRPGTVIRAGAGAGPVAGYLARQLRPATGYRLPVLPAWRSAPRGITLLLRGAGGQVGEQGYRLDVHRHGVVLRANTADGLFNGVQTLRQLMPPAVDSGHRARGAVTVAGGAVTDRPRFGYRGAMLDVARHFHPVSTVERYIDDLARYKVNNLHLHLTDDQGWRIQIDSWPRLTTYGGSTEVGGGKGGYYTKADYRRIVRYAASRHMTVIPEIDMPSHTNAALASYAKLNCDGVAPPLRTDIEVGYSSLCVDKDITYRFLDDVIRELAAMTPGPYLHLGGDEANSTSEADYVAFLRKAMPIAAKYGKRIAGWHEYLKADPPASAVAQYWGTTPEKAQQAADMLGGHELVLSPANHAYIDQQYNEDTPIGLHWAGYVTVRDSYDWDPAALVPDVGDSGIRGVEAPLWSETITNPDEMEYLAFPRLAGIAEIGWSPRASHDEASYLHRLGAQAPRWEAASINYYRSPQVPWK